MISLRELFSARSHSSSISPGRTFQKSGRGSCPEISIGLKRGGFTPVSADPDSARTGIAAPATMLAMNSLLFMMLSLLEAQTLLWLDG